MKKIKYILLLTLLSLVCQGQHIVISQVYGGGGYPNSLYSRDFIELYNPTQSEISLNNYTLWYNDGNAPEWHRITLGGTIDANHYYLIRCGTSGFYGQSIAYFDAYNSLDISSVEGSVVLCSDTNTVTSCPSQYVDMVGYGSNSDCYESQPSYATALIKAIVRINDGCQDTDDNSYDFYLSIPSPKNSLSLPNYCGITSVADYKAKHKKRLLRIDILGRQCNFDNNPIRSTFDGLWITEY